jgi:hypothetical protein
VVGVGGEDDDPSGVLARVRQQAAERLDDALCMPDASPAARLH